MKIQFTRKTILSISCVILMLIFVPLVLGQPVAYNQGDDEVVASAQTDSDTSVYPVKVSVLSKYKKSEVIRYIGILRPLEIRKKTFATFAEVQEVYVEEGQKVQIGDPLIKIDTTNVENELSAQQERQREARSRRNQAYQEMQAAKLELDRSKSKDPNAEKEALRKDMEAKQAKYLLAKAEYEKAQKDFDDGLITEEERNEKYNAYVQAESEYRQAQIKYEVAVNSGTTTDREIAQIRYNAAKAQYSAEDSAYEAQRMMTRQMEATIADGTMYADIDGYVVQLGSKPGEMVNPLMPAVVLGSGETVVVIGVSQNDVRDVQVGAEASIVVNGLAFTGKVTMMDKVPDDTSRTYETTIQFPDDQNHDFFIGESAVVEIVTGEKRGIWIPINIIMNDGQDFVYVVEEGRTVKKFIKLGALSNDMVCVEGLDEHAQLIVEGMDSLKPGYRVMPVNLDDEDAMDTYGPEPVDN